MHESFTPDEELIMLFLRKHAKSTVAEIARHTGLRSKDMLRRALDGLDEKGVLRHTDDTIERYYMVDSVKHTRLWAKP
jgi:DNA-binding IclR family transcriptional regulator